MPSSPQSLASLLLGWIAGSIQRDVPVKLRRLEELYEDDDIITGLLLTTKSGNRYRILVEPLAQEIDPVLVAKEETST